MQMQRLKLFEAGAIWKSNMQSACGFPWSIEALKHVGVPVAVEAFHLLPGPLSFNFEATFRF